MITFILILLAFAVAILITAYIRYAGANYPRSWRWEFLLIGTSFFFGCVLGALLFMGDFSGGTLIIIMLVIGSIFAFLYRFLFVHNMQYAIPKRKVSDRNDRH
jgi:hypothetical protein